MAEYILFYTFDNSSLIHETRIEKKVSQMTISQEIKSKTGGLTGWFSNIETGKNSKTRQEVGANWYSINNKFSCIHLLKVL